MSPTQPTASCSNSCLLSYCRGNASQAAELTQVKKHFESARERFLSPLRKTLPTLSPINPPPLPLLPLLPLPVEHGQYEKVIELGEKYQDFHLLVRLCDGAGDRERIKSYAVRFEEQGFAEFLFKEYLDQGTCI